MTMTHTPIQYTIIFMIMFGGFTMLIKCLLILIDDRSNNTELMRSLIYGMLGMFIVSFMAYCL